MADNFNMKEFLMENKLGAYSKLKTEGEAAYEYEKGKAAGEKEEKEKLAKEDYAGAEEEKMMDFLAEYEVIYVVENGRCYRITDEGYKDEVDMSKCRMYAENKEEKVEEGLDDIKNFFLKVADNIKKGLGSECVAEYNMAIKAGKSDREAIAIYDACLSGEKGGFQGPSITKATYGIAEKKVEEALSSDATERMDGLVPQTALKAVMSGTQAIIRDLKQEGFEDDEIFDFIVSKIKTLGESKQPTEEALGGKNPEGDALVLRFLQGVAKKFDYPVSHAANFVKNTIKSLGY